MHIRHLGCFSCIQSTLKLVFDSKQFLMFLVFLAAKSKLVVTCIQVDFFFLKEFFSDCFWSCTPQREWNIVGILPYSSYVMYFWHIKCLKKAIWFDRINYLITFFTNKCHFVVQCRDDFFFSDLHKNLKYYTTEDVDLLVTWIFFRKYFSISHVIWVFEIIHDIYMFLHLSGIGCNIPEKSSKSKNWLHWARHIFVRFCS